MAKIGHKSIRTRVWDGVGKATDNDGNTVEISTFDCTYEDGHRRAALALCRKMGWSGKLQGGAFLQSDQSKGMVWTWIDEECQIEAPVLKRCWLKLDQMEVGCVRHGKPSYRWIRAWRVVNEQGADLVQPWFRRKWEAVEYIEQTGTLFLVGEK